MIRTPRQALVGIVDFSGRRPWVVLVLALLLAAAAALAAYARLGIDTNTDHLFSSSLPWRQHSIQFAKVFPQLENTMVAVVSASTPEQARVTAQALSRRLAAEPQYFHRVSTPSISPFLQREGLLLLPPDQLAHVIDHMITAEPLLGPLANDPSARGLFKGVQFMAAGVGMGQAQGLAAYHGALNHVAQVLENALAGRYTPLSWRSLLMPSLVANGGKEFVVTNPVLHHDQLEPGAAATRALKRAIATLPGVRSGHARVNYTGSVPLSDTQFSSLTDAVVPITLCGMALMFLWLTLALRSWRLIVPVLITLAVGLICTFGFAAIAIGRLNLVSVAFAILFVGLAVDFGIQLGVRWHALRDGSGDFDSTLHSTAGRVGAQIALAALATSCGFLAFAPTQFSGVAELGVIAGVGMWLALLCTLTVLPALLSLLARHERHEKAALPGGARADAWLARHRQAMLAVFAMIAVAGAYSGATLSFDSNPLHIQRQDSEPMRTLKALSGNPATSTQSLNVLADNMAAARKLGARLSALPEVAQVVSGATFVPTHQNDKLTQIQQASDLMYSVTNPPSVKPPPNVTQLRHAAADTADAVAGVAAKLPADSPLLRIGKDLHRLSRAPDAALLRANKALSRFLPSTLSMLASSLSAKGITEHDLPPDLKNDWFTPAGKVRIQVTPTAKAQTAAGLRRFVEAVHRVAPKAVGSAVTTIKSADTILGAFRHAAIYAFLAITVVLIAVLRRVRDATMVLLTLLMSVALTALLARLAGMSINFANIIALPLLLGVGVSFNIYFVMNWRRGAHQFLESPTARAILFSALTTGTAFAMLAVSRDPGTAGMGQVLLLSLVAVLLSTFLFLPAMLFVILRREQAADAAAGG